MLFLKFGGYKIESCNLSDTNFFMNNRYSDPDTDPLWNRIRIHFFPNVDPRIGIHYYEKVAPDPHQIDMVPKP